MTSSFVVSAAVVALLAVTVLSTGKHVSAQAPPQPPQALTYDLAKQVIDAAEAEARRNKWNVAIVVTDAAGVPVMMRRLDGAGARPFDIAMRKAATVVASKLTTAIYGEQLKLGKVTEVPNGITFAGGVPILRGDEFIGAIGTSGVRAIEDEQISKAGASAIK